MPVYYSILAAILPITFYLFLIWKFDKYDREPVNLVLQNFLWGAVGAVIFGYLGNSLFSFFASFVTKDEKLLDIMGTILGAPIIEEITKGAFFLITFSNKKFDNLTDGIVYGGAIGLGFGMTENFLYFWSFGKDIETWLGLVIIRTLFSAVMHCISTASLGAFLGYSKYNSFFVKLLLPPLGFALAVIIHFTWNLTVTFQNTMVIGMLFMVIIILLLISAYVFSLKNEWSIIKQGIIEESEAGLIPGEHVNFLLNPRKNTLPSLSKKLSKLYKNYAVTLAFRKKQVVTAAGRQKAFCLKDIENLRSNIHSILEAQSGN